MSECRPLFAQGLSRRAVLSAGIGVAAFVTIPASAARAAAVRPPRLVLFNDGWRFSRGDVAGGKNPYLNDTTWAAVHLPHDWSIEDLPGAPKTTGTWTPPVALWSVTRVKRRKDDYMFGSYPDPSPDGPPLRVGPFDPVASCSGPLL